MFRDLLQTFQAAAAIFKKNQPLLLGGATAFFAVFSLAPITIILINVLSLYFQRETITEQLFDKLTSTFGESSALEIQSIAENFRGLASSPWITVAGSVFLVFVSTTLFHVVRQAINRIWNIRINPQSQFRLNLKQRASSFVIILSGGILFLFTLLADTLLTFLSNHLDRIIPSVDAAIVLVLGKALSLAVITLWFTILFKYLPDGRLKLRPATISGVVTAILFSIGQFILGKLLVGGNLDNIFGTSASLALLFLFIFYSSMIMYFGACFAYAYSKHTDHKIMPKKHARLYEINVLEE